MGGEESQPSEQGFDNGPASQDTSEEPPPPEDVPEGPVDAGGPEETDQDSGEANEPEGGDQSSGEGDDDQTGDGSENKQESPSNKQDKQRENEKSSQSEKGKKPPPGDDIFSRWRRGELTDKDLEKIKKDQEKQKAASAVPKGDWLPKGGGGAKHAQPKESRKGPSKIEQYQKEAKAKAQKWDDVQTWNNKMVERTKAQSDEIWEGVKKAGKGR